MLRSPAAIVTVGSELVEGLRIDTNTREIAAALSAAGFAVREAVSVGDDVGDLADTLRRLAGTYPLVVVTGGLGPTHDDVTREAAARALGLPLETDEALAERLAGVAAAHQRGGVSGQTLRQALVLRGAEVITPESGTAPGQIVPTPAGRMVLLPGPPHEMRPMLSAVLGHERLVSAPRVLSCVGLSEPDAQVAAQEAIGDLDVSLTVLATPALVDVVLVDSGAGPATLDEAAARVRAALGDACFADDGASLPEVVLRLARTAGATLAFAESCTGGMLAAALTDVPGASQTFLGSIVAYADEAKRQLLGVDADTLAAQGAVSATVAEQMAAGARTRFGATLAVSDTGIAGPTGATPGKPIGLVWFGIADERATRSESRVLFGDRAGVRTRAVVTALDLVRRRLLGG